MLSDIDINAFVAEQLVAIGEPLTALALRTHLVSATTTTVPWDHGAIGEAHTCWIVGRLARGHVELADCEIGFGPRRPLGFIVTEPDAPRTMGMDSQWYPTLLQAAEAAGWQP